MSRACSTDAGKRNVCKILAGKPDVNRPLGRPRRRWVDNIEMDLGDTGWGDVDSVGLAQDMDKWRAVVNVVMKFRVP
jgi:hypothetical protein